MRHLGLVVLLGVMLVGVAAAEQTDSAADLFPPEIVEFVPYLGNPVFAGSDKDTWDRKTWTNVQDEPVIARGPEAYDLHAVALNQVIKHRGRYYGYYHGSGEKPWRNWTTSVATSTDLIHWKKYPRNPIVSGDKSSGIVVHDGCQHRLYTMHPSVHVYFPRSQPK